MTAETARKLGHIVTRWWDRVSDTMVPISKDYPQPVQGVVSLHADMLGPFGDMFVAPMDPLVQIDFVSGINAQIGAVTVANSATGDTSAGRLRLQTGTNTAGSAIYKSRSPAKYRQGEGVVARFTCAFTTGVASSTQFVGAGDSANAYAFGFNGTAFGILHRNGGADEWIPQADWNGDKCNGSGESRFDWNKTYGCVCQIKYPFLGYGNITWWVQDPLTSRWILAHTKRYQNSSATLQISNPNLSFYAQALNSGNNTNLTTYVGSVGFFSSGPRVFVGSPKWAMDSVKAAITTETCLLNIRNATTYNGITNRSLIRFNSISCTNSGNNSNAIFRMKYGATIGGSPSWAMISGTSGDSGVTITSGNSVASYDVAGTTVANGTFQHTIGAAGNSTVIDTSLSDRDIILAPGEIMTISGYASASSGLGVAVNWTEDI